MSRHPSRAVVGFTLVELLVVIGIIALLISILLPSLNRARAAAKQAVCLSNVRQIAMACYCYAADNKGAIISAYSTFPSTAQDTINGVTGTFTMFWAYEAVQQQTSPYSAAYSFEKGLLGRYLKSEKVLECPTLASMELPPALPGQPKIGYGIADLTDTKVKNFAQIQSSSETAIFGDAIKYDTQAPSLLVRYSYLDRPSEGGPVFTGDTFQGRHVNGYGVVGFYDGHAESVRAQVREKSTYGAISDSLLAQLQALHIGPATPTSITPGLGSNYLAACYSNYDFYFWASKNTKK